MPEDKAAASRKGAAARAEKDAKPKPKSHKWKGLKLETPPDLPGTLMFDIAALQNFGDDVPIGPLVDLLETLVGPVQLRQIRAKVTEDQIPFEDMPELTLGLLNDLLGPYGLNLGEVEASAGS